MERAKDVAVMEETAHNLCDNNIKTLDEILPTFSDTIKKLEGSWGGEDAVKQLQLAVNAYNYLIEIREEIHHTTNVVLGAAARFRGVIGAATGGDMGDYKKIPEGASSKLPNTQKGAFNIDFDPDTVKLYKSTFDDIVRQLKTLCSSIESNYNKIMIEWISGYGRNETQGKCNEDIDTFKKYLTDLDNVSASIQTAIDNYGKY